MLEHFVAPVVETDRCEAACSKRADPTVVVVVANIEREARAVAERETLIATARLDAVIDGARDGIVRLSADLRIQSWNRAAQAAFGFTPDAVLEDFIELVVPLGTRDIFKRWITNAHLDASSSVIRLKHELLHCNKIDVTFPAECSIVERHSVDEDVTLFVRDLTEVRRLEAELRNREKLEALGRLTGGIAHEINTPLQYLACNIDFLRTAFATLLTLTKSTPSDAGSDEVAYLTNEIPSVVDQSLQGLAHIGKIVRVMKALTGKSADALPTMVNLLEIVDASASVAMAEWQSVATLEVVLEKDLPEVLCVPGEIGQVVLALVTNAGEAIAAAKRKSATTATSTPAGHIRVSMSRQDDSVVISVEDNGCGIAPECVNSVFDPFFSTKDVGRGMGQGLSTAHAIVVKKHLGRIELRSTVGIGTTVTVKLGIQSLGSC